jgi:hypothetical protein
MKFMKNFQSLLNNKYNKMFIIYKMSELLYNILNLPKEIQNLIFDFNPKHRKQLKEVLREIEIFFSLCFSCRKKKRNKIFRGNHIIKRSCGCCCEHHCNIMLLDYN